MRPEDAATCAVFMFELGWPPSEIDERNGFPEGFSHDAVVDWWRRMGYGDRGVHEG